MEKLSGFTQWQSLFHKTVSQAYEQESVYQLKTISMLNCALNREIEKLRDAFNVSGVTEPDLSSITSSQENCDQISSVELVLTHNNSTSPAQCANLANKTQPGIKTPLLDKSDDELVIESSPEIKKKHRHRGLKKLVKRRKILLENVGSQQSRSGSNGNVQKELDKRSNITLKRFDDKTPQKTDRDFESFIIDSTPLSRAEPVKKKKSFSASHKENSTLTQMFSIKTQPKAAKKCKQFHKQSFDSHETFINSNIDNTTLPDKVNNEDITNNTATVNVNLNDPDVTEDISLVFTEGKSPENTTRTVRKSNCEECDKVYGFYSKQGLYSINRLGTYRCLKHRCAILREDTIPGFWNMDVKTQDNKNT